MLVVGEIVWSSLFELPEMYMLDTSLQSGLQVKAQIIPSGLQEHSQIQILMSIIPIVFRCNTRYQPSDSSHYIDAETYEGWDSTSGNIWHEDRSFDPV